MLGRRSLSSDKKRGFRVEDGGLGAEERGWSSLCGGRFLPNHWCSRAPGGPHLAALGGCCACGGGCLQSCGAHSRHQTPLAALCLWATVTAPSSSDLSWPCLPLDLEEAAATSVSLRSLAPAACRVPGGLIKFDLFFFFFPQSKCITPTSAARRPLLSSTALGSLGLPLRVCPAACKAGDAVWGGVLSCRTAGGGHPRLLPR